MMTAAELEDVPVDLWIADGRVSMSTESEAKAAVQTPEQQPSSIREAEFTLQITGDDFQAMVSLDMEQAETLRWVLEDGEEE